MSPFPGGPWPEDAFSLTRQGGQALTSALEAERAFNLTIAAQDMPAVFPGAAEQACLIGEYAEWLAAHTRSGWATGIAGFRDDNQAFSQPWGFDLGDARQVAIWHGTADEIVDPAHASRLADSLPGAHLHLLPDEGHLSIALRFPEIIDDLITRAR